jgi:hypothetical protein
MKPFFHFCAGFVVALGLFALYFCCVVAVLPFSKSLAEFSAMFEPLGAFFTALAFIGLVITTYYQAEELKRTKREIAQERNERLEALIHVTRLQASGMRLISMAVEKHSSTAAARQELEKQVEEFEKKFGELLKRAAA